MEFKLGCRGKIMSELNWMVYNITEDDFIEFERCAERLKKVGVAAELVKIMALRCHICPFACPCSVKRESNFLGVKTC
jgi:hypothetical protein